MPSDREEPVIVCVCNRYSDRDIVAAARCGAGTAEEAYARLGGAPCCGVCLETAEDLIDAVRMSMQPAALAAE